MQIKIIKILDAKFNVGIWVRKYIHSGVILLLGSKGERRVSSFQSFLPTEKGKSIMENLNCFKVSCAVVNKIKESVRDGLFSIKKTQRNKK